MLNAHDDLTAGMVARSPQAKSMFGYRIEARLAGQIRERWEAQKTWPFLTHDDLQSIATPEDLLDLVRVRKGITASAAAELVNAWMVGYRSRLILARSGGDAFAVVDAAIQRG